jgi:protease-4
MVDNCSISANLQAIDDSRKCPEWFSVDPDRGHAMSENSEKPAESRQPKGEEGWTQDLISKLATAALVEQRRRRRWGIFFKFLFFAYLTVVLLVFLLPIQDHTSLGKRHTAVIRIEGLIASGTDVNADNVIAGLRAAFEDDKTAGIILRLNSPGGSPVQAGEMYDEIIRLRKVHPNIPIYAVAADVCASGAYYVASAADKIFANRASIIGSIGVRADGFGFVQAMNKLGIERRLYTAGNNKAFLDPFTPSRAEDVQHLQEMLADIHRQFIAAVRQGRKERLHETPELFSGLVWTGEQSLAIGLIDELADVRYVAEEVIGAKTIVDYTQRTRWIERIFDKTESSLARFMPFSSEWETIDSLR